MKAKERKEIKHDKFVESLLAIGGALEAHRRQVVAAVLVIAVVVGVLIWVGVSRKAARTERRDRLRAAEKAILKAGSEQDADARRDALGRALSRLRKIHQDYPGTPAGLQALYLLAETHYRQGNYDKALEAYRRLLAAEQATPELKALVKISLATALEQTGDWPGAAELYRARAAETGGAEAARAWCNLARCMEQLDRLDEADAARKKAITAAPDSVWADMAKLDARLARRPETAEKPPAPPPREKRDTPSQTPEKGDTGPPEQTGEPPKKPSP